jgi:CPA2 family monovalent cation:H+ antiporter-2
MHALLFIQDLAVIMLVAGAVTIIFHRFKQPVVLGYILAGLIIGPHTPPYSLISDQQTIETLAELGIVFLMFSLGLEFSLRKLRAVGATAVIGALTEIVVMVWIGYEIGRYFGWKTMDSIFLGAMLSISSTTIIVKTLEELNMKRERFAHLVFGILIVEDILAIGIIALLSGMAVTGTVSTLDATATLAKLTLFMVVALVLGILLVPKLLHYVASFKRDEMLLITVLGLCFGFCLLVIKLDYSVALGAFMIGAIMAESRQIKAIERLIAPIRDMFSAIFFVAIGLLLDPHAVVTYTQPIILVTIAVIVGKISSRTVGVMIAGHDGATSLRVGMGLAQIGEFSFIIATLGLSLGVISNFLYPIAVATSVITTLLTPYLIKAADPLSRTIARAIPEKIGQSFAIYRTWLQSAQPQGDRALLAGLYNKMLLQIFVNLCLVSAIFIGGRWLIGSTRFTFPDWAESLVWQKSLVWGTALVLSAPFLIAVYRKVQALSLLLADHGTQNMEEAQGEKVRRIISEAIPATAVAGIFILLAALSAGMLPPLKIFLLVLIIAGLLVALLRHWFIRMHYRLQITLLETLNQDKDDH